jgi:membrane protein implicated in regulation of membrane protease activity
VKRAIVAGSSVLASAASGLVTNVVTDRPAWPWWVALGVLVAVAVVLQVLVTADHGGAQAPGVGSVAIGGAAHEAITTRVNLTGDVAAQGAGAVSVAGDSRGQISTHVVASDGGPNASGGSQGAGDSGRTAP